MCYSEAAFFDGNHCQHVVAWEEMRRLQRIRNIAASMIDRRRNGRARRR